MLAQSFLDAEVLGLSEPKRAALITVLGMLERDELHHVPIEKIGGMASTPKFSGLFNMAYWTAESECGTVCCMGGTAELISGQSFAGARTQALSKLFYLRDAAEGFSYNAITPAQAARALRNFLTFGEARWTEVLNGRV
jgi:hypothetical protein